LSTLAPEPGERHGLSHANTVIPYWWLHAFHESIAPDNLGSIL
jgi:hypothetical protein